MTNLERIRNADPYNLASFLHTIEAGAIIEGRTDSIEDLLEWLNKEYEGDEDT